MAPIKSGGTSGAQRTNPLQKKKQRSSGVSEYAASLLTYTISVIGTTKLTPSEHERATKYMTAAGIPSSLFTCTRGLVYITDMQLVVRDLFDMSVFKNCSVIFDVLTSPFVKSTKKTAATVSSDTSAAEASTSKTAVTKAVAAKIAKLKEFEHTKYTIRLRCVGDRTELMGVISALNRKFGNAPEVRKNMTLKRITSVTKNEFLADVSTQSTSNRTICFSMMSGVIITSDHCDRQGYHVVPRDSEISSLLCIPNEFQFDALKNVSPYYAAIKVDKKKRTRQIGNKKAQVQETRPVVKSEIPSDFDSESEADEEKKE